MIPCLPLNQILQSEKQSIEAIHDLNFIFTAVIMLPILLYLIMDKPKLFSRRCSKSMIKESFLILFATFPLIVSFYLDFFPPYESLINTLLPNQNQFNMTCICILCHGRIATIICTTHLGLTIVLLLVSMLMIAIYLVNRQDCCSTWSRSK